MADPFIAEIRIFTGNFAPRGWGFCEGQILPIAQNTALFSLLGTTYGGDGKTTFALPDLRGRAPMHPGQGPGLSPYNLGQASGVESVILTEAQMPAHSHTLALPATDSSATAREPAGNFPAKTVENTYGNGGTLVNMAPELVGPSGNSQPHNNRQPYLALNFIIALQGVFPSRS